MKDFNIKLPTLWRQVFPAMVLGGLTWRGMMWLQGKPFNWPDTLPMMVIAGAFVLIMYFLQPTQAGEAGLNVMNNWGTRQRIAWSDIRSVNLARFYLLQPSLCLLDGKGKSYWIALDTKDLSGLHELASTHGGADHPLTLALETPLYRL